jgi:hypothetical protein
MTELPRHVPVTDGPDHVTEDQDHVTVIEGPGHVTGDPYHQGDRTKWQDNLPVIIGILSVAVVAIRLMGVARGDPAIAYAVLQAGGTGNVLIGTLVSSLGLLAIPTFAALLFYALRVEKKHTLPRHILLTAAFCVLYIAVYTAPASSFIISILVVVLVTFVWLFARVLGRKWQKLGRKWKRTTFLSVSISIYIGLVAVYEMVTPTPWLPIQSISLAGRTPFSGYVLSEADGETSILTSNPDGVITVRAQSVQATKQCIPHFYLEEQATIVYLVEQWRRKLTNYPPCPSTRYRQSG